LDIDWQKKFDQSQRQEYHKSEDLIEKLSGAHEQVSRSLHAETPTSLLLIGSGSGEEARKRHSIQGRLTPSLFEAVQISKALCLRRHLSHCSFTSQNGGDADVLVVLQRENESLRSVVSQMRQQIEALVNDLPSQATSGQSNVIVELQNENQTLRQQNRDLISRLDSRHSHAEIDHAAVNVELKQNPQLNNYVQSLNNTVGETFTNFLGNLRTHGKSHPLYP
jgi:hypothetical protein